MPTIPRQCTSLMKINKRHCERAALCTFLKKRRFFQGSLTVEAAVILPLFLIAMLTLICVIDVCKVQVEQQTVVTEQAKKLSTYAYLSEEYLSENYIDLYPVYPCELAVSLIPGYRVNLALRGRVHTWTGRSEEECAADRETIAAEMVYVTDNREVYHTDAGCSYLDLSVYAVGKEALGSARNESGSRYNACEKCCGSSDHVSTYYISIWGEKYHSSRDCSGLTRKVQMVRKTEVSDLPCCSRCKR